MNEISKIAVLKAGTAILAVQEYLQSNPIESLGTELGINVYYHPDLPLVGMKYSQFDSPKTHPVVRDCRGIVLEKDTWKVVALGFRRFFNAGEDLDNFKNFNWGDFTCNSKEDGSLALVYFYEGEWHMNTSGSFGYGECQFSEKTWRELFWESACIDTSKLIKGLTYIFELCTPWNKVIRRYPEPTVFLLSIFRNSTFEEMKPDDVDIEAQVLGVPRPETYHFKSMEEISLFLMKQEETDKTFEGVVIRDDKDERYKIKSTTYVALHHLRGEGNNIFNPKYLLPFILSGDSDEVLAYFPETRPAFEALEHKVDDHYGKLDSLWEEVKGIKDQRDFARAIIGRTPFTSILFSMKKMELTDLRAEWRKSNELILKVLKSN